jgi:hypothetical protein
MLQWQESKRKKYLLAHSVCRVADLPKIAYAFASLASPKIRHSKILLENRVPRLVCSCQARGKLR